MCLLRRKIYRGESQERNQRRKPSVIRVARFQARKQQEKYAADQKHLHNVLGQSSSHNFLPFVSSFIGIYLLFSEPTQENVSTDSNFAEMNIDRNVTISSEDKRAYKLADLCLRTSNIGGPHWVVREFHEDCEQ